VETGALDTRQKKKNPKGEKPVEEERLWHNGGVGQGNIREKAKRKEIKRVR